MFRLIFLSLVLAAAPLSAMPERPPENAPILPLSELVAGQKGYVWTVFSGREAEPFEVEVTGVVENSLGPGKSMILCQLTDPRVQNMGAVAGMSGSPLYIDGRFVGALSYQVQRFETVRYAGFTPAADLLEVGEIALAHLATQKAARDGVPASNQSTSGVQALQPTFMLSGVSPAVAAQFTDQFAALGVPLVSGLAGSTMTGESLGRHRDTTPRAPLRAGDAVAAALAVGDITVAATGTVSRVNGNRVLAFGHPLMTLGSVELPMVSADIVTILPSNLSSFKIANSGEVIGTVRQDRLSAIYGELGPGPDMMPVTVNTPDGSLHFATIKHQQMTPMIAAMGISQALKGSNQAGLSAGFRIRTTLEFAGATPLSRETYFVGAAGFDASVGQMAGELSTWLQNPVEELFPTAVTFTVEPLVDDPSLLLDNVVLSRERISPGRTLTVSLRARDVQGAARRESVQVQVPADWLGRRLEVVIAPGNQIDRLTGKLGTYRSSQIREITNFLDSLRNERRSDGIYVAVMERTDAFYDQTTGTLDFPGSLQRVATRADGERYQSRPIMRSLWETHLLPGRVIAANTRRALEVSE